ncbi:MAG TPA: leucine-rich repeat domain-containing protein, partial [Phycisphaerae bacterium]|nr:leucine-rich repeat domain-containing protein [Phycisphaerae bacterium]
LFLPGRRVFPEGVAPAGRIGSPDLTLAGTVGLESLPTEIGNLTNLRELNLAFNRLTSLPPSIGKLANLEHLHVGLNRLESLPSEIANLKRLGSGMDEGLYAYGNRIKALPPGFTALQIVGGFHATIELSHNQLTTLPADWSSAVVGYLHLNHNKLTTVPEGVIDIKSLNILILTDNLITQAEKDRLLKLWKAKGKKYSIKLDVPSRNKARKKVPSSPGSDIKR